MHLLLFDIDGTLIRSNGAGRAALVRALEDLFGTAGPIESYEMAGKTDPLIIGDLLTAIGLDQSDIEASLPDVYRLMTDYGRRMYVSRGIVSCAGVPELLQALDSQPEALVGLLTGNIISTAPLKLAAAGLSPAYFRLGAYGSDDRDRNVLPGIAMRRAVILTGQPFSGNNTTIIGDTPADIACARAEGARSVAVASGGYSAATLARYEPDFLLDNLADTEKVLDILLDNRLPA